MTPLELRQQFPQDDDFLNHPEVRRAYWRAVGIDNVWQPSSCLHIPPLLEAVEELRQAWWKSRCAGASHLTHAVRKALTGQNSKRDAYRWMVEEASLIQQFLVFLAVLTEEKK